MAMKHYPAEFKADAIALYRSRSGATFATIAEELGVWSVPTTAPKAQQGVDGEDTP